MTNNKDLLKEFIRAFLEESVLSSIGTTSTKGSTSSTVSSVASRAARQTSTAVDSNSDFKAGEKEIDQASQDEQDDLTGQVEANKTAIQQSGEVAGKISQFTQKMRDSNQTIQDRQNKIADANKILAVSKDEKERAKAYQDISQASTDTAVESGNVVDNEDKIADNLRRQSDAADKLK